MTGPQGGIPPRPRTAARHKLALGKKGEAGNEVGVTELPMVVRDLSKSVLILMAQEGRRRKGGMNVLGA